MSMFDHAYNMIIYHGIGEPVHGRNIVDSLNTINKKYIHYNEKITISQIKGLWKSYGNSHVNP